ncbi:MAG: hypothetical protein ACREA0_31300, partial [bacterium]
MRRIADQVEVAAATVDAMLPGDVTASRTGDLLNLLAWRLADWLVEHFAGTGRWLYRRRGALVVVSDRPEDNLLSSVLPHNASLPSGIAFQTAFELEVRVEYPRGRAEVLVALDSRSRPRVDTPVSDLISAGVPVENLYVRRSGAPGDNR